MTEETTEIVYKLCKRGHVRSPENVNMSGACKACKVIHARQYQQVNKEKIREQKKEYTQINKERIREHDKEYYQNNKGRFRDNSKAYRELNKERISTNFKVYRKNNKEQLREKSKGARNICADWYIASKLGIPVSQVPEDYLEIKRLTIQIQRSLKKWKETKM